MGGNRKDEKRKNEDAGTCQGLALLHQCMHLLGRQQPTHGITTHTGTNGIDECSHLCRHYISLGGQCQKLDRLRNVNLDVSIAIQIDIGQCQR